MKPTVFHDLAEFGQMEGKKLGTSDWHLISQKRIDDFAEVVGDHQWIHISPERALEAGFGGTIAHGFLILSLAARCCEECFRIENVHRSLNYGLDRVRFPHPVQAGQRVRAHVSLKTFNESTEGARYILEISFEIDGVDKPACVAEKIVFSYNQQTPT